MADPETEAVNLGRLTRLKFKHNAAAREGALQSIRKASPAIGEALPAIWQVRIGGRMRGRTDYFYSREAAEQAVHDHYNDQMLAFVQREGKRDAGSK